MKKKVTNFLKKNYMIVSICLATLLVIVSAVIIIKIINNKNKIELITKNEKLYSMVLNKKEVYDATLTYQDDKIIDIKANENINEDTLIYSEALNKIILPKNMIIYFYNKNNESYLLPKYSEISGDNNLLTLTVDGKKILKNNFYLYDNVDTYVIFTNAVLKYNGKSVNLSKYSFIEANNGYVMYYDYESGQSFYEEDDIKGATLYLNDYIIDLVNDASVKNENVNLLNRDLKSLKVLKED